MAETKYCNRCGRALDIWDVQEGFIVHKEKLGYGTKYDGDSLHLQLCCDCMEWLIEACAIYPIMEIDSVNTYTKEVMIKNEC